MDFVIEGNVLRKYNGSSRTVVIPEGVMEIGESAFGSCTRLQSLTIPESVTKIGKSAFRGCTGLQDVSIPKSVIEIGEFAFDLCICLQSVTIPKGVTVIRKGTFSYCEELKSVTIPESITAIGESAFAYCNKLQSVTIPESVEQIGNGTFRACRALTKMTVDVKNLHFNSVDDVLYRGTSLCCCPAGKCGSVLVEDGTKEIVAHAFSGCGRLQDVTIPESVTTIGAFVFDSCTSLQNLTILANIYVDKALFGGLFPEKSYPTLITAPHIPISRFDDEIKPSACAGFAKLYFDQAPLSEEIQMEYLEYIRSERKTLYPRAMEYPPLLQLMAAEKMIPEPDFEKLFGAALQKGDAELTALLLEYQNKHLKPVDLKREFELEEL